MTEDKKPRDINEYRKGLVCLVPRPGVGGLTCHEKTLCDCMVLEVFAAYDALAKENASLRESLKLAVEALEFYSEMAVKRNHKFIFDDETKSRGEVYEQYKEHSIGDLGMKAFEALAKIKAKGGL